MVLEYPQAYSFRVFCIVVSLARHIDGGCVVRGEGWREDELDLVKSDEYGAER